ncbi:MAG: ATP-binding protein [Oscillospiraceae bacterium]|nr:ATP-binding protein [Oscillospiraceae bacterium]
MGKTYSVLEFADEHYDQVAYVNFEYAEDARKIFDSNLEPANLIPALEVYTKKNIAKERTLIFFDEIQRCPQALTSLKYFCEFAPEYHVIAAGSLLGVAVSREQYSFPVGKVYRLTQYPMDFEEFLTAAASSEVDAEFPAMIASHFKTNAPMQPYYHSHLLEKYRQYLVVGGMPECVMKFAQTGNYELIRNTQNLILNDYLDDMSKYNTANEIKKTRLAYSSVTTQLSKKNTRFQYKLVKSGGRASEFENAIEWLTLSGIVSRVFCVDTIKKPLENYKNIDKFKIFFSDVGLLCARNNILANEIIYGLDSLNDFKGGMTENYVCTQLIRNGHICYSWQSDGEAELDFVINREGGIIPIEVKSAENAKAKSLRTYMQRYKPDYAIKISTNNFGFENDIKTIPLYAAFCL